MKSSIGVFVWFAASATLVVRGDEPKKPANGEAKPAQAAPAQAAPAPVQKPGQVQVQIQVQAGPGGIQVQGNGNAQIQMQINGGAIALPANAFAATAAPAGDDVGESTAFRTPDRTLLQRLTKSETLIEERRFAEAAEMLGGILERPEDYFFRPDKNNATSRSLKGEAQRRIGLLPPEGRDAYELQYGAKAKQMLDAAINAGDETRLAETSRRYFHTAAGLQATYLLGLTHLDHGRPLAAALCWRRLRDVPAAVDFEPELSLQLATAWARADHSTTAATVLDEASRRYPGAVLTLGGTQHRWPASDKALPWLAAVAAAQPAGADADRRAADEWLLTGGDASRNAVSPGSNPLLNRRWAVPYVNHPDCERLTEQLTRSYADQAGAPLPASQPLAVADVILMRTLAGLTAIDFRTGKRIWRGATDERLEQLLGRDSPLNARQDFEGSQLTYLLEQRLWHDAAFGTFSSDGRSVFCVEEDLLPNESSQRTVIMFNGRRMVPGAGRSISNRLAAYDLATEGKLQWELGGPAADESSPVSDTIFLGPPLPLGDRLYALGESKGEIRLFVVEAATGKLDWSQQLAMAPEGYDLTRRRSCGLSPSYADGVLICPTALGAVVAVDLNDRSLLWGFQYKQLGDDGRNNRLFMWQMQNQQEKAEEDRWHDALVTLAEGKVLITPPDGDQLYCLNLLDGTVAWQTPRDSGLYLACAGDGRVVVITAKQARAHRLADGKQDWTLGSDWPEGAKPSGRGFFNGKHYFVPLTSAEVAAVDVTAGRITARSRSRSGSVPGNLVCYNGAVLSQGITGLECFYQLEDLRRDVIAKLKERPNDPVALASQGELLLDEGKTAEAIAALRKAYSVADDQRTRNLLIDALLDGLGAGVATAESDLAELEQLALGSGREETYLRLRAEAHEKTGDDRQAFDVYLRLADLPTDAAEPMRASATLSIGREQRVKAKLQALYARAAGDRRKMIDEVITGRREKALASNDAVERQKYLEYFGHAPGADAVRLAMAGQAVSAGNLLEAETLLRTVTTHDEAVQREATARLAKLLVDVGRPREARPYLQRLEGDFAELATLDGKTGREVVAALVPAGTAQLDRKHVWPSGKVDVTELRQQAGGMNRTYPIEFRGMRGPYFENQSIEMDQSQQGLIGRDSMGVERWRVSLGDPQNRRPINLAPGTSHVRADGHLVILSLGYELVAVDVLGSGPDKAARVLWRVDLTDSLPGVPNGQNLQQRHVQMPWGVRFMVADGNGRPIGATGPVTARYVSFLKQRALHVVEPLTGKMLWIRHDIDPGSDLFGDDEYLFVTPTNENQSVPDTNVTTVYRVSDGEKVKELNLPSPEQRVNAYGRRLLAWSQENGKSVLKLIDGFDGAVVWSQSFTFDAELWPIDMNEIAVFTRAGKLTVLNVADGAKVLEASVMPEPQLSDAYVFRSDDSYLLVTNSQMRPKNGINIQPAPGGYNNPLINGYVYGFDRQTQKQKYRTRIAGQGLLLSQPIDLPMLVFASQIYEQLPRGQMRSPEAVLFCIDKRTGRTLYDKKMPAQMNMLDLIGEPERNAIVMKTMRNSLRFTFTDESPSESGDATKKTPTKIDP